MAAGPKNYRHLFAPFQLKHLKLKNHIVKAAQSTLYAEPDGSVGDRMIDFYRSIARGGVGLITVEEGICDFPLGARHMPHLRLDEDRFIPGLAELAAVIHTHHVPALVQVTHAGPAHSLQQKHGGQPVAPSRLEVPVDPTFAVSRTLSVEEIHDLVEKFARAARRCREAGFEGVELHMAHDTLGNAFLSRVQNRRQDEYGGQNLENRARFPVTVLRRVRELCGDDFVVGVRMNAKEWGHEGGTTIEEATRFARMFEAAGADYLQASAYGYGPFWLCALPDVVTYPETPEVAQPFAARIPTGALIPEAAQIKKAVSIPVSGVGRLDADNAERALQAGQVDLVCLGRRLLCDPQLPNKLVRHASDDIRPCLGCNHCLHTLLLNQPVACRMNSFLGHEGDMVIKPASKPKDVLVVGAGPAGMEAARLAAQRGHRVTLYDRARELGGLMPMAAFIKGAAPDHLLKALEYYETQLRKLRVRIELGREVTPELVARAAPDTVILAPGGLPVDPAVPGLDRPNAVTTEALKTQAKGFVRMLGPKQINLLTRLFLPAGRRVVVMGGDLVGLELAVFLAKRDRVVTIVEQTATIGRGMLAPWRVRFIPWARAQGIVIHTGVRYKAITARGLRVEAQDGVEQLLEADTVMAVTRYVRNTALYEALHSWVPELYLIGDARTDEPAYFAGALQEGSRVGLEV
jgi:2,4-dienoyl-CoA reductase-like NADH-dependent reductase (Old Yellow Enzyme family)/thioredoxin reductase